MWESLGRAVKDGRQLPQTRSSASQTLPKQSCQPTDPGGRNVGTHCLIDGFGKALVQDRAPVLVAQAKIQRHQEGVSEVWMVLMEHRKWAYNWGKEGLLEPSAAPKMAAAPL